MATEPRPGEEKASGGPGEMGSWRRAWPGRMDVGQSVKSLRWPDPGQLVGCMLPLSTVLGGHTLCPLPSPQFIPPPPWLRFHPPEQVRLS